MPKNKQVDISALRLDLSNYRTVKQQSEKHAVNAMISINEGWFWALLESILVDGYHPTENIILQSDSKSALIVKEGNRRIAALKIAHGLILGFDIPQNLKDKIAKLSDEWKKLNSSVPCIIYSSREKGSVDKVIALTHAKGEKAARDAWTAVAKARYDRDEKGTPTPELDLLEAYLKKGKNLSQEQAVKWAGNYPLTVLNDAIQKLAPVLGFTSVKNLVSSYPGKNKKKMDEIMLNIGLAQLGFKEIRDKNVFFGTKYGFNPSETSTDSNITSSSQQSPSQTGQQNGSKTGSTTPSQTAQDQPADSTKRKPAATASNDPMSVLKKLREFKPRGNGRDKIVTLNNEIKKLKIKDHPHAFCFLLRSMFELSSKAYCADHASLGGPSTTDNKGNDRNLAKLLGDIIDHIINNSADKKQMKKVLHGVTVDIGKHSGILSITSLNQLVHNPSFSIIPSDISLVFGNIFPLLEEMNK